MDGFDMVFPELQNTLEEPAEDSEKAETEAFLKDTEESENTPEAPAEGGTIAFRRDHRELQLPLTAVEQLAETLGMSPREAVDTLQKGCNYDRMVKRASIAAGEDIERSALNEQGWVDFFMQNRQVQPLDITEEMYRRVEEGMSPREVYLELRLKETEQQLMEQRSRDAAALKSSGSLAEGLPDEAADPFERAFDSALRVN